jgi:BppU N-terminal domain
MTAIACRQAPLCCGPFVAGEIPDPLVYQFQNADGSPIDLQGYQVQFCFAEQWGGQVREANAQTLDAAQGTVTYDWAATDLALPGRYLAMFWAKKAAQRYYASVPIRFDVAFALCVA